MHRVERFVDAVRPRSPRYVVQPGKPFDVLASREHRLNRKLLGYITDVVADVHRLPTAVQSEDIHLAGLRGRQRRQHPHHRGLSRTVRPEQTHRLPGPHLQREIVNRDEIAVPVRQMPAVHGQVGGRTHLCLSCNLRVISDITDRPRLSAWIWFSSRSPSTSDSAARPAAREASATCCAESVSRSRPTRRSSLSTARVIRPSDASLDTSVDVVFGTSPSSAAASVTEMSGRRPTNRNSSACAPPAPAAARAPGRAPGPGPPPPPPPPDDTEHLRHEVGARFHDTTIPL